MAPDFQPPPWRPADKRPPGAPSVETVTLIRVRHCVGAGIEGDPIRQVDDYYTEAGEFFCRKDEA